MAMLTVRNIPDEVHRALRMRAARQGHSIEADQLLVKARRDWDSFDTEEAEAEKFKTSAESRFSANSKEMRVRVEFSKKRFTIVISRSEGTFFIGRLMTSMNWSAVSKMRLMSSGVMSFMPNKCFVDN